MYRWFYSNVILVLLLVLLNASISSAEVIPSIGRLPGAKITNKAAVAGNANTPVGSPLGSCNPKADPSFDGVAGRPAYEKSCSGQGITREGTSVGGTITKKFSVKVTFDPKQPNKKINPLHPNDRAFDTDWTAGSITVVGAPILPMCNTNVEANQNEDTCNSTVCPATNAMVSNTTAKTTTNCYPLAKVEDDAHRQIIVQTVSGAVPGTLSYDLSNFRFSISGGPVLYVTGASSVPVYFISTSLKHPTSGNVKVELMSGINAVKTKCKNSESGEPVASTKQPTSSTDTCDTHTPAYVPITGSNGSLITTGVSVLVDLVYTSPLAPVIPDPSGVAVPCTSGQVATYGLNKYVRAANCTPQKDLNRCKAEGQSDASLCTRYVTGGGNVYDESGNLMSSSGAQVMAVSGPSTTSPVAGSLYSLVFNDSVPGRPGNNSQMQSQIMGLAEKTFDLYADAAVIPYPQALVSFELRYDGNKACVYANERIPVEKWRVEGEYPKSLNEVYAVLSDTDMNPALQPRGGATGGSVLPSTAHCVDAPPKSVNNTPLSWGSLVSPICTKYDASNSQFKWPNGKTRAFTGVVVECIEDTLMGIFYPRKANASAVSVADQTTIFSRMQNNIQSMIRAVMFLYIIFFGYKLMIGREVPKREQWMWLALKFALITYFALGSGMVDLLPKMLTISKNLSVIVMESGLGVVNDPRITSAQSSAAAANDNAVNIRDRLNAAIIARNQTANNLAKGEEVRAALALQVATALVNKNTSKSVMDGYTTLLDKARADLANLTTARNALINTMISTIQTSKNDYTNVHNTTNQFTAVGAGSYKVPSFCTAITVELWGGGAAGRFKSSCTTSCDYSGGAGGYARYVYNSISAGSSYEVNVGGGGSTIGAAGGRSSFSLSGGEYRFYADGGSGMNGGGFGGTANGAVGGSGVAATCLTVAGGSPFGGSGQPASSCNAGGNTSLTASPGAGGCASDDSCANSKWGVGTNGRVLATCTSFDFTNLNNVDTSNAEDVTFRDNLRSNNTSLQNLQSNDPQALIDKQAEVTRLERELIRTTATYNVDLTTYNNLNAQLAAQIAENLRLTNLQTENVNSISSLQSAAGTADTTATAANQSLSDLYAEILRVGSSTVVESNTGYSYCDFRFYSYPQGKGYMKLWDMIDCKFSKYLGIGDNVEMKDAPQVILVALLAPLSMAFGIPIFFFAIMFLTVVIMIIVRAVHIYIMSFIGLILLVYISPLVIPAVLFEFTKGIFQSWLQQLMALWLQPVILFAFLSFMFACIDTVMFGDNHQFSANNRIVNTHVSTANPYGEVTSSNKTCGGTDTKCRDSKAIGYIYQASEITKRPFPVAAFSIFKIWNVDVGTDNGKALFIGLSKLILISLIVYSVLSMVETMSNKLVGGMGEKGAAALSGAPVAGPAQVMGGIARGIIKTKDVAYSAANAAIHYKSTGRAIKRALLNSAPVKAGKAIAGAGRAASSAASWIENKRGDYEAKNAVNNLLRAEERTANTPAGTLNPASAGAASGSAAGAIGTGVAGIGAASSGAGNLGNASTTGAAGTGGLRTSVGAASPGSASTTALVATGAVRAGISTGSAGVKGRVGSGMAADAEGVVSLRSGRSDVASVARMGVGASGSDAASSATVVSGDLGTEGRSSAVGSGSTGAAAGTGSTGTGSTGIGSTGTAGAAANTGSAGAKRANTSSAASGNPAKKRKVNAEETKGGSGRVGAEGGSTPREQLQGIRSRPMEEKKSDDNA